MNVEMEEPVGPVERSDPILLIDQPSFSGFIYPRPMIESIVAEFNKGALPLFGGVGSLSFEGGIVNVSNASHIVTHLEIKGDELWATVSTLGTPQGDLAKKLIIENSDSIALRACGNGTAAEGEKKVIESYLITSVDLIDMSQEES